MFLNMPTSIDPRHCGIPYEAQAPFPSPFISLMLILPPFILRYFSLSVFIYNKHFLNLVIMLNFTNDITLFIISELAIFT